MVGAGVTHGDPQLRDLWALFVQSLDSIAAILDLSMPCKEEKDIPGLDLPGPVLCESRWSSTRDTGPMIIP